MKLLALLLLLAAPSGRETIVDEHLVPPGDWKYREINLHGRPARISASFHVLDGSDKVRAALMLRQDLEWMDGDLTSSIAQSAPGRSGGFVDSLRRTGDYVVVLDNQEGKLPGRVLLRVELDYSDANVPEVKELPASRRYSVVMISLIVFFAAVGLSARQLRRNMH